MATGLVRRHGPWLALFALALAAYYPALRAGTVWDDKAVFENPLVLDPAGLARIWFAPSLNPFESHYWPLAYTSFWIECRLWGTAPAGYHLTNIIYHALCAALLWRLLRRLGVPGAWLAAAIFALHPVHVESVAWIIERKDVLSAAFYLGAALTFFKMRNEEIRIQDTEFRIQNSGPQLTTHNPQLTTHNSQPTTHNPQLTTHNSFLAPFILFACALLSKSVVVTLPVALAIAAWWSRGRLERRQLRVLSGLALLALAAGAADWILSRQGRPLTTSGLAPLERLLVAGRAFWFYLAKLAWPHPLAALYPQWTVNAHSLTAWLPLAAAAALFALLWGARRRIGRGPFAAMAFYAVTLAPALGLIEHNFMGLSWVADRFQYLASIGPIALFSAFLSRARNHKRSARLIDFSTGTALIIFFLLTWRQAGTYRDSLTLFNHAVAAYPSAWAPRFQLGLELARRGQNPEALAQVAMSQHLNPRPCAPIHEELGRLQSRLGRRGEAEQNYRRAIDLDPSHPVFHNSFGVFLASAGREDEAFEQFRAAVRLRPDYPDALSNLSGAWLRRGSPGPALVAARRAVALNPYAAEYHAGLALACAANGLAEEALAEYRAALRLNPNLPAAHANLGGLLLERGDAAGALAHLEAARKLGLNDARLKGMLDEARRRTTLK